MRLSVLLLFFCFPFLANAAEVKSDLGEFSGRVSKINKYLNFMRIRVDFKNAKYLNVKDKVEFWSEVSSRVRCNAFVKEKTNEYILFKVPEFDNCITTVKLTVGSYLKFYSEDLVNNIKMGYEVLGILQKKKLALGAKLNQHKAELESYIEKINASNQRYDVLREKLQLEWQKEISDIENDKTISLRNYKNLELRIEEVEQKLEQYRVFDQNLMKDRWALDSNLYKRK